METARSLRKRKQSLIENKSISMTLVISQPKLSGFSTPIHHQIETRKPIFEKLNRKPNLIPNQKYDDKTELYMKYHLKHQLVEKRIKNLDIEQQMYLLSKNPCASRKKLSLKVKGGPENVDLELKNTRIDFGSIERLGVKSLFLPIRREGNYLFLNRKIRKINVVFKDLRFCKFAAGTVKDEIVHLDDSTIHMEFINSK